MNPFYTHRPHLINTLNSFDYSKPVRCLEFGTGDGSAEVFKDFTSKYSNLHVEVFETDRGWLDNMTEKYQAANYKFNFVDNWADVLKTLVTGVYDLAFVDSGTWDSRIEIIDAMKDNCRYIILHDYDYYNVSHYNAPLLPLDVLYDKLKELGIDISSCDETSFFAKYLNDFNLTSYADVKPPTLVFENKKLLTVP